MKQAYIALLASLATLANAGPLKTRSNGTPWPSIPQPKTSTKPSGDVYVKPVSMAQGITSDHSKNVSTMTFAAVGDSYTLDFERDVAGVPFFEISELGSSYAQIEIKYTESFAGLNRNYSDGPFPFANGLSSMFRVETLNVTKTGELRSFFVQGSQRWSSIKLIKGAELTIKSAGFISTVDESPLDSFPGYFASANSTFTNVWNLGPRTQQLITFEPKTQPTTWEIDAEKGAYVRGQKPATTVKGATTAAMDYNLTFEAMIDYGGVGWRLDTEIDNIWAQGPLLVLTSNYPEGSFVNYNTTLLPPNTLVLGRGWALQNQSTLPGWHLDSFPIPFDITEKTWHNISTHSYDGAYEISIDGTQVAAFNLTNYGQGSRPPYFPPCHYYSFALGPWQDQAAWYRQVEVTTAAGVTMYSNPMTSADVLVEYGVATNDHTVQSDAGKRDRYSWLGDRSISARVVEAVGSFDVVKEVATGAFSRQIGSGYVPSNTLFSELDALGVHGRTGSIELIYLDWDTKFVDILYQWWIRTGDTEFIRSIWPQLLRLVANTITQSIDPITNIGSNGGSSPALHSTCFNIQSFEEMVEIGAALGYNESTVPLATQAQLSRKAVESYWNETAGVYNLPGAEWTLLTQAMVQIIKLGPQDRRDRFWQAMPSRLEAGGYTDPPSGDKLDLLEAGNAPINANTVSHLLWAAGERRDGAFAQDLIARAYGPQALPSVNYTGAFWEFMAGDGTATPGNGFVTAGSHGWGSFPTPFLTEYTLGVKPTSLGFKTFSWAPLSDWKDDWVQGRVPTPHGIIYVAHGYDSNSKIMMEITAPEGTTGYVSPPFSGPYSVNGKRGQSSQLMVKGGQGKVMVQQE